MNRTNKSPLDPVVVLLGHKARVGKDTLAEQLKPDGWVRLAFADKLKETVADLYDFSHEQMYGDLKDVEDKRYPNARDPEFILASSSDPEAILQEIGNTVLSVVGNVQYAKPCLRYVKPNSDYKPFLTPRRALQLFGQDQRSLYPDIWAAYVVKQIILLGELGNNKFIITDFRFPNEHQVVSRLCDFGVTVRTVKIEREDKNSISGASDISETALDDFKWDIAINNNGTPSDLANKFYAEMGPWKR